MVEKVKFVHYIREVFSFAVLRNTDKFDWVFQDIDHATYAIMDGSRLVPCPDCLNVITSVLIIN